MEKLLGVFETVDEAIDAAVAAQKEFVTKYTLQNRENMICNIRKYFVENATNIAEMMVTETKLGRMDDKIAKLNLTAMGTAGTEVLKTNVYSSHQGLTVEEGAPYGLIGAVTPVTNPVETIIGNGISMIAGGNAVIFNVHPSAKTVSSYAVNLINEAISDAGGPKNLVVMVKEPTFQTMLEIGNSSKIKLLVGTGGPGMVKALLGTGKKVIAAGAGNPPSIVDETANIELAGASLVASASFDNNILCIGEKEIFAVESIADRLIKAMIQSGAYHLNEVEVDKVTELVLEKGEDGTFHTRKEWIGQNAGKILNAIGVSEKDDVRLLIFEAEFNNPFVQLEQMMPVMPIVRCESFDQACDYAISAEHDNKHSASIWSNNTEHVTQFGKVINTTIFVQNGSTMSGIGYGGSGTTTATIATPTGEGITNAMSFTRRRRFAIANGGGYIL